jgi:hypothetical protein
MHPPSVGSGRRPTLLPIREKSTRRASRVRHGRQVLNLACKWFARHRLHDAASKWEAPKPTGDSSELL